MIEELHVGFWGKEPHEHPIHYPLDWGVKKVIKCLEIKEEEAVVKQNKGQHKCLICGQRVGSAEYTLDDATQAYIWVWPESLKHYILKHHIAPDYLFYCFVIGRKPVPTYKYQPLVKKSRFYFILRGKVYGSKQQT